MSTEVSSLRWCLLGHSRNTAWVSPICQATTKYITFMFEGSSQNTEMVGKNQLPGRLGSSECRAWGRGSLSRLGGAQPSTRMDVSCNQGSQQGQG